MFFTVFFGAPNVFCAPTSPTGLTTPIIPATQADSDGFPAKIKAFSTRLDLVLKNDFESDYFLNSDRLKLHFLRPRGLTADTNAANLCKKGLMILVPGLTEISFHYAELYDDLRGLGACWFILDYRGQGLSEKTHVNGQMNHVEDFDAYVRDLTEFIGVVRTLTKMDSKIFVIGHSTGGLIAALAMMRGEIQVKAAVLSAPLMQVRSQPFPELVALGAMKLLCWIGRCGEYIQGQSDWDINKFVFENTSMTSSQLRFERSMEIFHRYPDAIKGGVSNGWVRSAITASRWCRANAKALKVPTLVLAPQLDTMADRAGTEDFCAHSPHCKMDTVLNARHVVFLEDDWIRNGIIKDVLDFFGQNGLGDRS